MSVGSRGAISLARDTTVIDSRAVVISVVHIIQKVAALMTLRPAVQHRAHGAATNPSLRRRQSHDAIADRAATEMPRAPAVSRTAPGQPIPRQNLYASARLEDRARERILAERLAHQRRKPVAPFLKSTGLVTTSTRMPTGTVIMTPPTPRAAPSATWRHRSPAQKPRIPSRRSHLGARTQRAANAATRHLIKCEKVFGQQGVTSAIPGHSVHLVSTGTWRGGLP